MLNSKVLSNSEFLDRLQEYLPTDAEICQTDAEGHSDGFNVGTEISENEFYLFDAEALNALSHVIEEVAMEEARGEFLAVIQTFDQFEPLQERFWQLAATLDHVQVIASGTTPERNGHVKFCNSGQSPLNSFWILLFKGVDSQILFLGEQSNKATNFEDKKFVGFYTLNPRVIDQAREEIVDLLGGKCPGLRHFSRLYNLDQAAKKLKVGFAQEQEMLDLAFKKLKAGTEKYEPQHFIRDLDKTLERLTELKNRLPELIVGH